MGELPPRRLHVQRMRRDRPAARLGASRLPEPCSHFFPSSFSFLAKAGFPVIVEGFAPERKPPGILCRQALHTTLVFSQAEVKNYSRQNSWAVLQRPVVPGKGFHRIPRPGRDKAAGEPASATPPAALVGTR